MFWKLDVFHGGARVGLGFEVVISELENYTIIFYINIYLSVKFSVSRETLYLIFIDRLALLVKNYR